MLTALLPVLLLAACGHAAAPGPPPVTLSACGSGPAERPGEVLVICFTNDITAQDLKWRAWGKPTASASGTALVDLCAYEDCHTGSYGTVPIILIASKLVRCRARHASVLHAALRIHRRLAVARYPGQLEYLGLRGRAQAGPAPGRSDGQPGLLNPIAAVRAVGSAQTSMSSDASSGPVVVSGRAMPRRWARARALVSRG